MSQIKEEDMSALDQGNFFDNDDIFSEIDIIASTEKLIVSEELFYRQIEDWISFTRRNFDCHINGEPHQAVNFLLNPRTGEYLIRVWSRTVTTGYLLNLDSVSEKIQETFQGQLPCTGFLSSEQEQIGNVIFTDFPFSRMMSSNCAFLTQKNTTTQEDEQLLCNFCVYMNDNIDKPNALNGDGLLPPPNFPEPKPNIGTTSLKEEPSSDEKMSESEEECADNSFDLVDPSDPEETKVEEAEVPNDHQCTRCPEILKSKKDLVNHEYYEHMRGTYPCKIPQCQFQGSFAEDYVQHLNGEHAGEMTTLNCRICKEYIPTHDFCQHLK